MLYVWIALTINLIAVSFLIVIIVNRKHDMAIDSNKPKLMFSCSTFDKW